ncbi:MAG: YhdP family protein [Burkholderiales bacterium]
MARWLIPLHWSWRVALRIFVLGYFLLAIGIIGLRYWVLPQIPQHKERIEALISQSIGERATIGDIVAGWGRLHPTLDIADLKLHDKAGNVVLSFAKVGVEVSWRSLLVGGLRFHSIVLDRPALRLQRSRDGTFSVAGIEIRPDGDSASGSRIGDWLLRQGELVISGGTVEWIDEARGAPPLTLTDVGFRLVNEITGLHRFALRAIPPPALASAIDVRGQFRGNLPGSLSQVRGELFAALQYADLAGWKAWVDYPFAITDGRGAMRIWSALAEGKITEATADVALGGVQVQFAADLPVLALNSVEGRLGVREIRKGLGFLGLSTRQTSGYRVFGENVILALAPAPTPTSAVTSAVTSIVRPDPTSFSLQWERKPGADPAAVVGSVSGPTDRGEFRASVLQLGPLADLAEALPFPAGMRRMLIGYDPRGTLSDLTIAWTGHADTPDTYQARGRFAGIGFKEYGRVPGVSGLSGSFEATQRGGNASVGSDRMVLTYPLALRWTKALEFDSLAAQVGWTITSKDSAPQLEIKIPSIRLANREVSVIGSIAWMSMPDTPGNVDVDIRIPSADPAALYKYIPGLEEKPATWLKNAFLAGTASDGRVRIKGNMYHFPFAENQHGVFQVNARANGITLKFAPDFPPFQHVNGEVSMRGTALDVRTTRSSVYGVDLGPIHVRAADLDNADPLVVVDGTAVGATTEFMRYIAESPLNETIGAALGSLKAQGRGRLTLGLELPLKRLAQTRANGSFEFLGNEITLAPDEPPVTNLSGKVEFQDRGVSAKGLTGEYHGGVVRMDLTARDGALQLSAQGSVGMDSVRRAYNVPFGEYATGTARYSASIKTSGSKFDLTVESNLLGVKIALPPPFGKTADTELAFKLVRSIEEAASGKGPPLSNQMRVSIGPLVDVLARFRLDNKVSVLDQAAVMLGDVTAVLPDRPMVTVSGNLKTLDLDQLMPVLRKTTAGGPATAGAPPIGPITMHAAELIVAGRRLRDAQFHVDIVPDGWTAAIVARELAGDLRFATAGDGRMTARFKSFVLPESVTPEGAPEITTLRELPGLDIVAESFTAHGKRFGRLEFDATNETAGWRIKKITLAAPEGTIHANGLWQPPDRGDRTELDVAVDVSDVGGYLERVGQPNAVAGAQARLEGKLAWKGRPTSIDYPTLAGNLSLKAASGRFLKAEPGIARLLGVLSLQSLPRRISLDFRDVFSDGFSFDEINATASIANGVMTTSEFQMIGPAAGVGIAGDVDLNKETQKLRVRVVPIIGDSVAAVAGLALLNPLVGLGSFIAQRLLKDPIGQLLAHEYAITGSWADPKVERISMFRAPNSTTGEGTPP